jgi:hypothetical protein
MLRDMGADRASGDAQGEIEIVNAAWSASKTEERPCGRSLDTGHRSVYPGLRRDTDSP